MNNKKGFTLVELLAVVVILSMIMLIAIPNVMSVIEKGKKDGYLADAKKFVYLIKYHVKKGEINKPAAEESVKITLKDLASSELTGDKDSYKYDKDKSYVYITRENGKIEYYVQLVADKSGNGSLYRGILLVASEDLYGEDKYEKYQENITKLTELTPIDINKDKTFVVGIATKNTTVSAKSVDIVYGKTAQVVVVPLNGYYLKSVSCTNGYTTNAKVGTSITTSQTVTIMNNNNNNPSTCTFNASKITYPVTIKTTSTTTNKTTLNLEYNGTQSATITPASGYFLESASCSDGYTLTVKKGLSATNKQTAIVANNGVKKSGECTFVSYPAYPVVTGGSTTWTKGTRTFTVIDPKPSSLVTRYEYYISGSNTKPENSTKPTGSFTTADVTISTTGKYIYFRIIYANGITSNWTDAHNLYIDSEGLGAPTVIGCSDTWTLSKTIMVIPPATTSGISKYEYYISESTTKPAASQTPTASLTNPVMLIDKKGTYAYFRVVNIIGVIGEWTTAQDLYVDPNTYTIEYVLNGGTLGSEARKNYNVETPTFDLIEPKKVGYTFSGWYEKSNFSGSAVSTITKGTSGNKKFYAKWTANKYLVTLNHVDRYITDLGYDLPGTDSVIATIGEHMPPAEAPVYPEIFKPYLSFFGYHLYNGSGWDIYYDRNMKSVKKWNRAMDSELSILTGLSAIKITVDKQGGTGGTDNFSITPYNPTFSIKLPKMTGYTFGGYYTEPNGAGSLIYDAVGKCSYDRLYPELLLKFINANRKIYAYWIPNKNVVTLDMQGGTGGTANIAPVYGSDMPKITCPIKEGYAFTGYFTSVNGGGTKYYNADCSSAKKWDLSENGILYANWKSNSFTITLDRNGGTGGSASVTATYGADMPTATAPTRTGYTFGGYYLSVGGALVQYYTNTMTSARTWNINSNSTLTATWTANSYNVLLDKQGGTGGYTNIVVTYNKVIPKITVPTRTGYTFGGYYTGTNGTGTKYYNADGTSDMISTLTADTTLYAKWISNTYTITLDRNGGTGGTASTTVTYNGDMPKITAPTRTGYTFNGYYLNVAGVNTQYYDNSGTSTRTWNVASDATLIAVWTPNEYIIKLDKNGGYGGSDSVTAVFGELLPRIDIPERENYDFLGYYGNDGIYYDRSGRAVRSWEIPSGEVLHAEWEARSYPAEYHECTTKEIQKYDCHDEKFCRCDPVSCNPYWCPDWDSSCVKEHGGSEECGCSQTGETVCCECGYDDREVCSEREITVDCSYYDCPYGGIYDEDSRMCYF